MGDLIDNINRGHVRTCGSCGAVFESLDPMVADGLLYNHRSRKHDADRPQ